MNDTLFDKAYKIIDCVGNALDYVSDRINSNSTKMHFEFDGCKIIYYTMVNVISLHNKYNSSHMDVILSSDYKNIKMTYPITSFYIFTECDYYPITYKSAIKMVGKFTDDSLFQLQTLYPDDIFLTALLCHDITNERYNINFICDTPGNVKITISEFELLAELINNGISKAIE